MTPTAPTTRSRRVGPGAHQGRIVEAGAVIWSSPITYSRQRALELAGDMLARLLDARAGLAGTCTVRSGA